MQGEKQSNYNPESPGFNFAPSARIEAKEDPDPYPEDSSSFRVIRPLGSFRVVDHKNQPLHAYVRVVLTATYTAEDVDNAGGLENLKLGYHDGNTWVYVAAIDYGAVSPEGGTVTWAPVDDFSDPPVPWGA